MGIFLIKIYSKYFKENINTSKKAKILINDNNYHKPVPNPLFKNQKIITDKHTISIGIDFNKMPCYEIYKLKNIKSSIYIAFQNLDKQLDIFKYNFATFSKILTINITPRIIKYFYDEIENKEYLIIQTLYNIHIYLILN